MAIEYIEQPLPRVEKVPFSVNVWRGLSRIKGAENSGEMVSMKNMSSDNAPFASPRKSREVIAEGIENPQNLFSAGDKIGYIAGGKLYYDGNVAKDEDDNDVLIGETSAIVDFNGNVVMYPSNVVYDYMNNKAEEIKTDLTVEAGGWYPQTGAAISTADDVTTNNAYQSCAAFRIAETITTSDDKAVVINTNIVPKPKKTEWPHTEYSVRLYVVAFKNSEVISYKANGYYYKRFNLGEPIYVKDATSYKIMIGYTYSGESYPDVDGRDADFAKFGNGELKIWRMSAEDIPAIQYACVDNNRIFAAQGNHIYASSQGSYSEWTEFADEDGNPDPLGSYKEDLDTPQDITGIMKYRGNVVITKPDLVYESYGNKPPYRIVEVAKTGCIDGRSIVEVNSVLYWLGRKGVYAYTGGQPQIISEKINKTFESGIAGTDGRKYYISAYDGEGWGLYVYDTFTGLWHMEDDIRLVGFAYAQGYLHALSGGGVLYRFGSGSERVIWEFETQDFTFGIPNTKTLSKLYVRVQMQANTYLDIYMKKDNGEYEKKAAYHAKDYTVFDFKAKVKKFDSFAIKFTGMGDVRILDIHGDITVGSAKHRTDDLSVFRG